MHTFVEMSFYESILTSFTISFVLCYTVIFLSGKLSWLTRESDLKGVQKFHSTPTPRIAGIPIYISFFLGCWVLGADKEFYFILLLISMPVFIGGLTEDLSAKASPQVRMIAALVSTSGLFFLLDIKIDTFGFEWIDYYFNNYIILSFLFTMLVVSGVVNAINIIDGYNGLMPGYSIFVLLAISYVASLVEDDMVLQLALILASSLVGFFVFNFPFGRIFIGDGGAYFVGFIMSVIGLMLGIRNNEVSHWFVLLLFIYPLYETVFSIYRKKFLRRTLTSHPDGYHLHMFIYKRLVKRKNFKNNKALCNSMTSPFLWLLSLVGIIPAVIWYDNKMMLIVCAIIFMVIYTIVYRRIVHFKFKFKK